MTHKARSILSPSTSKRASLPTAGQAGFWLMSTFCFILILRNSDAAVEYMGRGLTLCAKTVIPSLFPFMVISELLVSSGAGEALGRLFSRMMRRIFGISGAGASALFLGSMCGFPVGAKTAVSLYDRGVISRSECQHLFTFTCNPSSAFLITAVGVSLYDSRALGVTLYCVVLGCGLLTGFLARFFLRSPHEPTENPHFPSGLHAVGVESFTGAVSAAATGMLGRAMCALYEHSPALWETASGMLPDAARRELSDAGEVYERGMTEAGAAVAEDYGAVLSLLCAIHRVRSIT